jgi:hypothetical protein
MLRWIPASNVSWEAIDWSRESSWDGFTCDPCHCCDTLLLGIYHSQCGLAKGAEAGFERASTETEGHCDASQAM